MSLRERLERLARSKFVRDVAVLQASGVVIQATQIASSVALAHLLGAAGQGAFNVALMLQALVFFVVSVGLVPATVSQVAAASARGLEDKVAQWLAFLLKGVFLFSLAMVAVGAVALPWVGESWYEDRTLGVWAWWLTFQMLLDLPRWVCVVAFQGTRRMGHLARMDNGQELLRAAFVLGGAWLTDSVLGAVVGQVAASGLTSWMAWRLYRRARADGGTRLPTGRELLAAARDVPLAAGMRLGVRVGLLKNTNVMVLTILPRLLVGGLAGMEWVAYFHIAQKIMGLPLQLMQAVTRNMLPALAEMAGLRDLERFRRVFWRVTLAGGVMVYAAVLVTLALVRPVVTLLYPADFPDPVFENAAILALGFLPFSFAMGLEPFYIVSARIRVSILLTIVGGLITIPANVLLVSWLPRTGAAWGVSLYMSWVLVHLAYIAVYFRRSPAHGLDTPAAGG